MKSVDQESMMPQNLSGVRSFLLLEAGLEEVDLVLLIVVRCLKCQVVEVEALGGGKIISVAVDKTQGTQNMRTW